MSSSATSTSGALAQRFHALSDETRLRIVELLRGGEHCVCELTEALELKQSLLSFHIKVLKEAGLVCGRREGRWAYYALAPQAVRELNGFFNHLSHPLRRRVSARCCD